jgi:Chlorophyll A-B binding protein
MHSHERWHQRGLASKRVGHAGRDPARSPRHDRLPSATTCKAAVWESDALLTVASIMQAEIKHGRLAMIAFLGYGVQALAFGEGVLGSLAVFSKSFQ